jgi:polar amino acid transport system ATP-binding protein
LLRCLNLLETPSGGRIFFKDTDLPAKGTDVPAIRQKMGMVFQSFNLYAHLSVLKNLTTSRSIFYAPKATLIHPRGRTK